MTLILQISGVPELPMLTFMASRSLTSVSPIWRQFIIATEILCRDSSLVVL